MPVSLTCTGCKTTLKVRDDLAGKKVKCPRCATTLVVPSPEEEIVEVEAVPDDRISKTPAKDKPRSRRDDPDEDEDDSPRDRIRAKGRGRDPDDDDEDSDRGRGRGRDEKHSAGIRAGRNRDRDQDEDEDEDDRPRAKGKGRNRDEDDDEDDRDRDRDVRKSKKYKPCPRCGATGAKKVLWTAWGSFYGPSLFNHVRCPECGYCYNGKSGGSNLLPAIIFVTMPLLGILTIIGGLFYMLYRKGYFG